jgi:hypothetical protein
MLLVGVSDAIFSYALGSDAVDGRTFCDTVAGRKRGATMYYWSSEQIRRASTLCKALWWAIEKYSNFVLALGRLTTHGCEEHFGHVRELLPQEDSWERWLCTEVRVIIDDDVCGLLDIPNKVRAKRLPVAGVVVRPEDPQWPDAIDVRAVIDSPTRAREIGVELMQGDARGFKVLVEYLYAETRRLGGERLIPGQGADAGVRHVQRIFAGQ